MNSSINDNKLRAIFSRKQFFTLGYRFDVITMNELTKELEDVVRQNKKGIMLSTPNVNLVIEGKNNGDLREAGLRSDWVVADGVSLVRSFRRLGIKDIEKISGSSFIRFLFGRTSEVVFKIFYFGGQGNAPQMAHDKTNAKSKGLVSVGFLNPGFGSAESMSTPEIIHTINKSSPDFLLVALGAAKGMKWIVLNINILDAKIISYLGATVNFVAGTVRRAPLLIERLGFEWVWRMIFEPEVRGRYVHDGINWIQLGFTHLIPLRIYLFKNKLFKNRELNRTLLCNHKNQKSLFILPERCDEVQAELDRDKYIDSIMRGDEIVIDAEHCHFMDSYYLAILSLVRKFKKENNTGLVLINSQHIRNFLKWSLAEWLFDIRSKAKC